MKRITLEVILAFIICSGTLYAGGEAETKQYPVESAEVTIIRDRDRTIDWSHERNLIAISMTDKDGFFDIALMKPDGSDVICLTCNNPDLPARHISNPTWHPSGEFIVFQAEKDEHFGRSIFSTPGVGYNCDLWAINSETKEVFQLTNLITKKNVSDQNKTTGVLHPHFSNDGGKLFWGQLEHGIKGKMGDWQLKVGDFVIDDDGVALVNIITLEPGDQKEWYESHGFSPDDKKIIFSASPVRGQSENYMDIYTMELESGKLERLTDTLDVWDEHAHYSPDGRSIVWISSVNDFDHSDWRGTMKTEFFLMNADGTNKRQLTSFNDPEHPHYSIFNGKRVICADSSWDKTGAMFMGSIAVFEEDYIEYLIMVELK